jgi:hypothetical protein
MTLFIVCLLTVAVLLQTMRTLSGVQLVLAGVVCLGLLWPLTKFVLKGEAAHYAVKTVTQQVLPHEEDKKPAKEVIDTRDSWGCRMWNRIDRHKKHGLVRDSIRTACNKEEEE